MNLPLLFVLLAFAAGRITRLVVADDFPPIYTARRWICQARPTIRRKSITPRGPNGGLMIMREGDEDYWWLGELVTCAWCASGWVSLGLWLGTWWFVPLPLPLLWWPATWAGGAWLSAKLWT